MEATIEAHKGTFEVKIDATNGVSSIDKDGEEDGLESTAKITDESEDGKLALNVRACLQNLAASSNVRACLQNVAVVLAPIAID